MKTKLTQTVGQSNDVCGPEDRNEREAAGEGGEVRDEREEAGAEFDFVRRRAQFQYEQRQRNGEDCV